MKTIQEWGLEFTEGHKSLNSFKTKLIYSAFPDDIKNCLNDFFKSKNLSGVGNAVFFIRNGQEIPQTIHVDSTSNGIHNASIIVPLRGCQGTYHQWYGGGYTLGNFKQLVNSPPNTGFRPLEWTGEPILIEQVEVSEYPILSRINIPHTATCGDEQRVTLSFRFIKNYTFEEVAAALDYRTC